MKIFNSSSIYQLLQFLLLTEKNDRKAYIIGDKFPKTIIPNLDKEVILIENIDYKINNRNRIDYLFKYIIVLRKIKKTVKKKLKRLERYEIYGVSLITPLLAKKNRIYLLEDGTGNYIQMKKTSINWKLKILNILHYIFWRSPALFQPERSKLTEKLYLTGIGEIPDDLKDKVLQLNLAKLWKLKSQEEQQEILAIYNLTPSIVNQSKKRKIILFTQPLSEDNFLNTEQDKIDIYIKSIEPFDNKDVLIKKHPRDKTNYKKYIDDVEELPGVFPFQLLDIIGVKYEIVITLFSTAVLGLEKNAEIIWYGTELSSQLKEKFGELPIEKFKE